MHDLPARRAALVKSLAAALGFDHCGIARAIRLDDDARRLERWLSKGMHGGMSYMERNFDLRVDPTRLVPGARSVITLLLNHFPEAHPRPDRPRIARYAWGRDYHDVIRPRLNTLLDRLREAVGDIAGRGFVDSAPVLERSWAQRSGLGWVGRNGNLIHKGAGSYFFIATLITDLELTPDDPVARDYCGSCRRCVEACPTEAIGEQKVVDGSKCISYFTIELKEAVIPPEMQGRFGDWAFGCDICQEVCPWNRFATPHHEPAFEPIREVLELTTREWAEMREDAFNRTFRHSPIKRAKYQGLMRNIRFLQPGADGHPPPEGGMPDEGADLQP
jgi:epoxyqueuosine reductase